MHGDSFNQQQINKREGLINLGFSHTENRGLSYQKWDSRQVDTLFWGHNPAGAQVQETCGCSSNIEKIAN